METGIRLSLLLICPAPFRAAVKPYLVQSSPNETEKFSSSDMFSRNVGAPRRKESFTAR